MIVKQKEPRSQDRERELMTIKSLQEKLDSSKRMEGREKLEGMKKEKKHAGVYLFLRSRAVSSGFIHKSQGLERCLIGTHLLSASVTI